MQSWGKLFSSFGLNLSRCFLSLSQEKIPRASSIRVGFLYGKIRTEEVHAFLNVSREFCTVTDSVRVDQRHWAS